MHTVPLELAGTGRSCWTGSTRAMGLAFEVGAVAGPLLLQRPATRSSRNGRLAATAAHVPAHGRVLGRLKYLTHRYLLVIVVGLMLFHLYDLRRVLSAFFAKGCCAKRPRPVRSGPPSPSAGWSGHCCTR